MTPGQVIRVDCWPPSMDGYGRSHGVLRGYRYLIEDGNVCLVEEPVTVWQMAEIPRPIQPAEIWTPAYDAWMTVADWYGRQAERHRIEGEA